MQPINFRWSFTHSSSLLGFQDPTVLAFLIASFQSSLLVTPLNTGASEISLQIFTHLLVPSTIFGSLMAFNDIFMLIQLFISSPHFYEFLTCAFSYLFIVSSWVMNNHFKFDTFQNTPPTNHYSFAEFPNSVNGNTFKAKGHGLIPVPLFLSYPSCDPPTI